MKAHGGKGDISEDVAKAIEIVKTWNNAGTKPESVVPKQIIQNCHGLVFLHFVKIGAVISGSVGSGFVIAKINKGTPEEYWSGPSALSSGAFGVGAQVGGEMVHNVLVLNTAEAVEKYYTQAKLKVGTDLAFAYGHEGARIEDLKAMAKAPMSVYSYSKGASIGASVEGTVLGVNREANHKFYGKTLDAEDILTGTTGDTLDSKHPALTELYLELGIYKTAI